MMKTTPHVDCPFCGTDWIDSDFGYYMLEISTDYENGDAFVRLFPCCLEARDEIEARGYEGVTGRTVVDVVREVTSLDVLEITEDTDASMVCRLRLVDPTTLRETTDKHGNTKTKSPKGWQRSLFDIVTKHHRHHQAPRGWKFGVAVRNGDIRTGVAIVGRPVSRVLDDGTTLEVTRVCTMGASPLRFNSTSKLYSAAAKRAKSLGYQRLITYTLHGIESGASLVAAGWHPTRISGGGSWNCDARKRTDKAPTTPKVRWERGLNKSSRREIAASSITL